MSDPLGAEETQAKPLFMAVLNSTKQLYQVLKCLNFSTGGSKVHIQISQDSIRFSAEYGRTMQGVADLSHELFSSYELNLPDEDDLTLPRFQISLPALLETLQIFGAAEQASRAGKDSDGYSNVRNYRSNHRPDAFSNQAVGLGNTCTFVYLEEGSRLSIVIQESNITTTCNLATYLADHENDIPFDRQSINFKIIMLSPHLLDSLAELAPSGPSRVTIVISDRSPYLSLSSSGTSNLGSTSVDFGKARELLETFDATDRWVQSFQFDMIKYATEAMRISQKVSLRGDGQGVLNAQFLIPVEGAQGVSPCFLDFLFVPSIEVDEEETEVFGVANGD
ncbi:repair protein Rad1/Rec1/Rad17 [Zalerion maritima]|uniref:Repair protein Rad1/Rec1/Rad17 n=1 Tax=Zalerion maritima TaxID=339359 RepID=A0AAD5RWE2_9PEZI|nr:repair protein Rad1/Rec1/Rad17 [Zalerion maritima]